MSSVSLLWYNSEPFLLILSLNTGGRAQHLLLHVPSSGSCRELWGHSSAFFSPNETSPKSSVPSNRTLPPALSSPLLPSSGHILILSPHASAVGPRADTELKVRLHQGCRLWDTSVPGWWGWVWCTPGRGLSSGLPGCIADSHWACCWPAHRGSSLYFGKLRNMNLCSGLQNYPGKPGLKHLGPLDQFRYINLIQLRTPMNEWIHVTRRRSTKLRNQAGKLLANFRQTSTSGSRKLLFLHCLTLDLFLLYRTSILIKFGDKGILFDMYYEVLKYAYTIVLWS